MRCLSSQLKGLVSPGSSISRGGIMGGSMSSSRLPLLTSVWSMRISNVLSGYKSEKQGFVF